MNFKNCITLSFMSILMLSGCSDNEPKVTQASNETTTTETTPNNDQVLKESDAPKIGDTITFDKEAEITIKEVAFTDYRNEFADLKPAKVLVVTYDVKNLSENDYVVGSELSLYVNGKKAETYPIENVTLDSISAGRIFENAQSGFAIMEDGDIELEIVPTMSFTSKPIVMPIKVTE